VGMQTIPGRYKVVSLEPIKHDSLRSRLAARGLTPRQQEIASRVQCASSLGTQGLFQQVSGEGVCLRVEWQLRRIQFDLLNFRYCRYGELYITAVAVLRDRLL
jgi:hypothetical protein